MGERGEDRRRLAAPLVFAVAALLVGACHDEGGSAMNESQEREPASSGRTETATFADGQR